MTLERDLVIAALPSYEVGEELGRGAWGVVLAGRHRHLEREVAIKQLPRALGADPAVRARFAAEAKLLASLDHPHIVPVYDYLEVDGICLLVMEKLPGGTVWSRFTSEGVTPEAACAIVLAACAGLHAAHLRGILHRDVKPENLMFSSAGTLKITDFGIAKVVGGNKTMATKSGEVLGTPAYMAPEQAQGGELGPATDVYATGVLVYELLSGRLPFADDGDALATLYRHVYETPEPLAAAAPSTPGPIAEVVMRSLAASPADRFPSAEAFGVAMAEAATEAWGPGWPEGRGKLAVLGSSSIVAATERSTTPVPGPPAETAAPVRASRAAAHTRSVPAVAAPAELRPVHEVLEHPRFPVVKGAAAAILLLVAVALGLLGVAGPERSSSVSPGVMLVNDQDAVTSPVVRVDMDEPLDILCAPGVFPGPEPPAAIRLEVYVAGVPVGTVTAPATKRADGFWESTLDAAESRFMVGGMATADMTVLTASSAELGALTFPISIQRNPFLTAVGAALIVALLFFVSYGESVLRFLRQGRHWRSGRVAMVLIGTGTGAVSATLAGMLTGQELSLATVILAALVGAVAGFFLGGVGSDLGRFRRVLRRRPAGQRS